MIFLDSSYFKGLLYPKDPYHDDALNIKDFLNRSNELTVLNTTVLVETLNWSVKANIFANLIYGQIKSNNMIISLTREDYIKSLEINCWFGNSINYSDCTIVNTMLDMEIDKIVTFDDDFKKIDGFNIISEV